MSRIFTWIHGISMVPVFVLGFHLGTSYAQDRTPQNQTDATLRSLPQDDSMPKTQHQEGRATSDHSQQNNSGGFSQRQARDEFTDHR